VYDAIVLAGGRARRLGGAAKPQLTVGGRTLLDAAVAAVARAGQVVVVGPEQPVGRPVIWRREEPPGGGPVAALAAGLPATSAPLVVVLAADLPAIAPAVPALLAAVPMDGAAVLTDAAGRANYLAAVWSRPALAAALASLGRVDGAAMRALVAATPSVVPVPDAGGWGQDCDTWDELARARAGNGGGADA
jgi:molybdopterin-guanine dinucleotide biosynthesis protein A